MLTIYQSIYPCYCAPNMNSFLIASTIDCCTIILLTSFYLFRYCVPVFSFHLSGCKLMHGFNVIGCSALRNIFIWNYVKIHKLKDQDYSTNTRNISRWECKKEFPVFFLFCFWCVIGFLWWYLTFDVLWNVQCLRLVSIVVPELVTLCPSLYIGWQREEVLYQSFLKWSILWIVVNDHCITQMQLFCLYGNL